MPERLGLMMTTLPPVRGKLIKDANLAPYTWFRVGGPADWLFLPEDEADLAGFLKTLDPAIPVTVLGVGSNVIVRDGGIAGVVVRLMGKYWGSVEADDGLTLTARPGALDLSVAKSAARAGITGLEFLSGIPGSLGARRAPMPVATDGNCAMCWWGSRAICGMAPMSPIAARGSPAICRRRISPIATRTCRTI